MADSPLSLSDSASVRLCDLVSLPSWVFCGALCPQSIPALKGQRAYPPAVGGPGLLIQAFGLCRCQLRTSGPKKRPRRRFPQTALKSGAAVESKVGDDTWGLSIPPLPVHFASERRMTARRTCWLIESRRKPSLSSPMWNSLGEIASPVTHAKARATSQQCLVPDESLLRQFATKWEEKGYLCVGFTDCVFAAFLEQLNELVALIPHSDQRLRPQRTKQYVLLSVLLCLLASGLVFFFLFPHSVLVDDDGIRVVKVTFNKEDSLVVLHVTATLRIRNSNFYSVAVTSLFSQVQYMRAVVGTYVTTNVSLIPPRSEHPVKFTVKAEVGGPSSYVYFFCTVPAIMVHNIVIFMRTSVKISYIGHISQSTLETQHYVDCGVNSTAV